MCFPLLLYYALPFIAYCVFTQLSRRRASSMGLITASSTVMQFASASMHFRLHVSSTAKHTPVPTCAYAYVRLLWRYIRQCLHAPTPTCVPYGDKSASAYMDLHVRASPTAIHPPVPTCATLVSVSYGDTSARAYMRLHCQRPHASTMNHMRLGYNCTCMHKLRQQGRSSIRYA
ncbi:hypothetical protein R3P38DRAFT_3241563 [Favolaschia claudopus]|uniref:Secreted protein n=1 Tax=Favolaschia claudopus TaxID=2862362 RepID=A0AAV9Z6D0_9AGAR